MKVLALDSCTKILENSGSLLNAKVFSEESLFYLVFLELSPEKVQKTIAYKYLVLYNLDIRVKNSCRCPDKITLKILS